MVFRSNLLTTAVMAGLLALGAAAQPPVVPGQGPSGRPPAEDPNAPPPFLSPIFGDNMVMQRGKPNPMWGWSTPGDNVKVEVNGKTYAGTAAADGRWQVKIDPLPAGGPYTIKISGKQSVTLHEVLSGDVWIASGQSNMGFGLSQARNGADEVKNATHPLIRVFNVGERTSYTPMKTVRGSWRVVYPSNLSGMGGSISATAYFFARRLQEDVNVPIGIIQAAVGGAPAETLAEPSSMRGIGNFTEGLAEVEQRAKQPGRQYGHYLGHWLDEYDTGNKEAVKWSDPAYDDSSWKAVQATGDFKELGMDKVGGLIWIRKEFTLPDPLPAANGRISLGSVDKMDTVYVNGQQVGSSSWVENPRNYGARGLKPGRNVIAIRLFRGRGGKSFISPEDQIKLTVGTTVIPLTGEWKGKVAVDGRPPQKMPIGWETNVVMPGVLYNGMVGPIVPLAITGAIWYQGESNTERAEQYRSLLPAFISGWRKAFGQGDFPFYVVGLPFYQQRKAEPGNDSWAELREAQVMASKKLPHVCTAITVDTGDAANIHPPDKKEGGERLAQCALADHYGMKIPFSGPTLAKVENVTGGLKLTFDHADGGLTVKGDKLGEFSVAGEDKKWYWADAKIEGNTITVSSPQVKNPKAVRYAWQANPLASLYNGVGLPAVPFRTDNFPGVTDGNIIY